MISCIEFIFETNDFIPYLFASPITAAETECMRRSTRGRRSKPSSSLEEYRDVASYMVYTDQAKRKLGGHQKSKHRFNDDGYSWE